jgi:hypothetical protein
MSFWCVAKNSQELPEDSAEIRRNASELTSAYRKRKVCILYLLVNSEAKHDARYTQRQINDKQFRQKF